jgi:hypothetical protein
MFRKWSGPMFRVLDSAPGVAIAAPAPEDFQCGLEEGGGHTWQKQSTTSRRANDPSATLGDGDVGGGAGAVAGPDLPRLRDRRVGSPGQGQHDRGVLQGAPTHHRSHRSGGHGWRSSGVAMVGVECKACGPHKVEGARRHSAQLRRQTTSKFLKVFITNIGRFPLHISSGFFYWKVPFRREFMHVWPLDYLGSPLIPSKHYPTEISPRASESFTICDVASLEQEAKRMRGADTFANRVRFRFIKGFVQTDDGRKFRVKLSSNIRQVWSGR